MMEGTNSAKSAEYQQSIHGTNSKKSEFEKTLKSKESDADDFYVFIYDEEDKKFYPPKIQRVLGFWCMNAGIGFR